MFGEPYTAKSDVWSLGIIFFEALFGRTPYLVNTVQELVSQTMNRPIMFPDNKIE